MSNQPPFTPDRLTCARHIRGLSAAELAEKLDVTYAMVRNWETGSMVPTRDDLSRMSFLLDFPPAFFSQPRLDDGNIIRGSLNLHTPNADLCKCGQGAEYLCDQRGDEGQFICSKPLCHLHAVLIDGNDYCPKHTEWQMQGASK